MAMLSVFLHLSKDPFRCWENQDGCRRGRWATHFATALVHILCWLHMIIHLECCEHLANSLFLYAGSVWHWRENQPCRASSASTLCSRSDYNLCWLDCLQSHSKSQAPWMLVKCLLVSFTYRPCKIWFPVLVHYSEASASCLHVGCFCSWKLCEKTPGEEAAFEEHGCLIVCVLGVCV